MNKIWLVIRREYSSRVGKPSFWILTILVPLLLAALYAFPLVLANRPTAKALVYVVDETGLFLDAFESTSDITYKDIDDLTTAKQMLNTDATAQAIVFIPARETTIPNDAFLYYYNNAPSLSVESNVNLQLQTILRNHILLDVHSISPEDYSLITRTKIKLRPRDLETGKDGFLQVKIILGAILSLLIFVVIFSFGSQVMSGVMEEKKSRILEVIICSIKPFQLMMGKIVGIGLVGLTQFALWLIIGSAAFIGVRWSNADLLEAAAQRQSVTSVASKGSDAVQQMANIQNTEPISEIIEGISSINFGVVVGWFFFYFLIGYLLYATLFAAIGAMVDDDTDTHQFALPLSIPLILTLILLPIMYNEPSGSISVWLSMIPLTSPVAMLFRIPFGVPVVQLVLSSLLLLISFPIAVWFSAKIYRNGILAHGKTGWRWVVSLFTGK